MNQGDEFLYRIGKRTKKASVEEYHIGKAVVAHEDRPILLQTFLDSVRKHFRCDGRICVLW
jgi:hypothetical protein